jgi:hypothetical protein
MSNVARLAVTATAAMVAVVVAGGAAAAPDKSLAGGRVSRTVEGIRFSFSVPRSGWEYGPARRIGGKFRAGSLFIGLSTTGSQAAEAVIFWTGLHGGGEAAPCARLLSPATRGSTADLATAVARAPGTKVVKRATRVTIGGRPSTHMVLTLLEDLGCDPGFFFTWRPRGPRGECWGACWLESSAGDTIRVWIVDVGGRRLFIEAATRDHRKFLAQEIEKIVRSIRFESVVRTHAAFGS